MRRTRLVQERARRLRVLVHVPHQIIQIVEFFLVADLRDELHLELAVVQVAREIEYMHFEQRRDSAHRGPKPQARYCVAAESTVYAAYAHRVNPRKRQLA